MPWQLTFDCIHQYDAGDLGVTVPVVLRMGAISVDIDAKVDS